MTMAPNSDSNVMTMAPNGDYIISKGDYICVNSDLHFGNT